MTTTDVLLPTICPSWCLGPDDHAAEYAESFDLESAQTHRSRGFTGVLPEVRDLFGSEVIRPGSGLYELALLQPPMLPPTIELEVSQVSRRGARPVIFEHAMLRLTASEARSLAAQLTRLADAAELGQ